MNILIVDDDSLVCQSLRLLLGKEEDFDVIGAAVNGQEAVELARQQPDVILMDIQMPVMDGIESTKIIKEMYPSISIMMLTTFRDEKNIRLALKAGADGYLLKHASIDSMAQQIRALCAGAAVVDAEVLRTIAEPNPEGLGDLKELEYPEGWEGLKGLTERETEIVACIAQGCSNKEIAERLFLSVGTVRNMLSVILDKLEMRDRTQLAIYYWQRKRN